MIYLRRFILITLFAVGAVFGVWAVPPYVETNAFDTWTGSSQQQGTVRDIPVVNYGYTNGTFVGRRESAYYGVVQVKATIKGGRVVRIVFLSYPNDNGTSRYINSIAMPRLKQEAIQVQGSHVRHVSGATFTSEAFHLSLHTALLQAVN